MSLEQALADLTATVAENNTLLKTVIGNAAARVAAGGKAAAADDEGAAEDKPARRGRGKAAEKDTPAPKAAPTPKEVVSAWLNEIEVEVDDDGEPVDNEKNNAAAKKRDARKKFVKKCLSKLDADTVADLDSDADKAKLVKWIEAKKAGEDPFEDD